MPSMIDLDREKSVQLACLTGIRRGLVKSAHDASDGGLAVALAESCITRPNGMLGVTASIKSDIRLDALIFGESASRIIISVENSNVDKMLQIAHELGSPASVIGEVGGRNLNINDGLLSIDLSEAYSRWRGSIASIADDK